MYDEPIDRTATTSIHSGAVTAVDKQKDAMKRFFGDIIFVLVIFVPPLALFVWLWGAQFFHATILFAWGQASWLVPLVIAAVLFISGIRYEHGGKIALSVLSFLVMVGAMIATPYQKSSNYFDASVTIEEVEADELSFRDRAPYDIATAVSPRNLGSSNGDPTGILKSIPAVNDHGMYSTSVVRREMFAGYERTQFMEVPLFGEIRNDDVTFCDWSDDANFRFGGWLPTNNLKRAILWNAPMGSSVSQEDAIAVCEEQDEGHPIPMLYVPITTLQGVFFPTEVPGGVAIYNGSTGEITVETSYDGDLPLYPSSIATKQRQSTQTMINYWDYTFMHAAGWEDTSVDEHDPNGENRSEFNMASEDGDTSYIVTPLTPRGNNSSISALGAVEGGTFTRGELNQYTVNTYKEGEHRPANSSVASTIKENILGGFQAQGLTVFEVVPGQDGKWVATVGGDQSINYRAEVHTNGDVYLYNANGELIGQSGVGDAPAENTPDETPGENGETLDEPTMNLGKPLDEMTSKELREAANSILDELERRAADDAPPGSADEGSEHAGDSAE